MADSLRGAASIATAAARGFMRVAAKKLAEEYSESIRKINPDDLQVLIQNDISLLKLISKVSTTGFQMDAGVLRKILQVEPAIIADALCAVHPPLTPVLNTPAGLAWLGRQRATLKGAPVHGPR